MKNPYIVRNLFGIIGLDIRWYAVIICAGILAGLYVSTVHAKKRGYNSDMTIDLLLICIPLAIVCARIYYVIFEWDSYKSNPISALYIWEGGIAIYGAVIGSVIGAVIFHKYSKVPFGDILDVGAVGLILGQAIGRWGNFANQEAYGNLITDPSLQWFPYGVYIDSVKEWHQATFFYESMWNLLVFVLLLIYFRKAKHKGNVFVMYLVLYGIGRAYIEGLREDSLWLVPGVLRVSQILSIVLVVFGTAFLLWRHSREAKEDTYTGKYALAAADEKEENVEAEEPEEGSEEDIAGTEAEKDRDKDNIEEIGEDEQDA